MKTGLPLLFALLCFLALGCTKRPTPEYESSLHAWQREQCDCFAVATEFGRCQAHAPWPELNVAERLLANAGLLTDARQQSVKYADDAVSACAARATDRLRAARERGQLGVRR